MPIYEKQVNHMLIISRRPNILLSMAIHKVILTLVLSMVMIMVMVAQLSSPGTLIQDREHPKVHRPRKSIPVHGSNMEPGYICPSPFS